MTRSPRPTRSFARSQTRPNVLRLAHLLALCLLTTPFAMAGETVASQSPAIFTSWQTFTAADGLPEGRVLSIRKAGDDLWVGAEGGLARWDGAAWTRWTHHDGLPDGGISTIAIAPQSQDLWLGTWGGGLVRLSGGRFDCFTQFNSGLAGDQIFAVSVIDGRIWIASNGGLSSFDPIADNWGLYAERRASGPEYAFVDLVARPEALCAASWCEGLRRFDLKAIGTNKPDAASSDEPDIGSILLRDDTTAAISEVKGSLVLASQTALWRMRPDGQWESREYPKAKRPRFIQCVAGFGDEIWVGTDSGILVLTSWSDRSWISVVQSDDGKRLYADWQQPEQNNDARQLAGNIADNHIRCIAVDENEAWIGTASGLVRATDPKPWQSLQIAMPIENVRPESTTQRTQLTSKGSRSAGPTADHPAIAILAPSTKVIALPGEQPPQDRSRLRRTRASIQSAVSSANAKGGYHQRTPYAFAEVRGGFERYGWGMPGDEIIYDASQDNVLGIVGAVRPNASLAMLTALRSELPLVNASGTPESITETINPWVFRCRSNDPAQHRALLDYIVDKLKKRRLAVLRTPDPTAAFHLDLWSSDARDRNLDPVVDVTVDANTDDLDSALSAIRHANATVILTWTSPRSSEILLQRMRESGMKQVFVGSDRIVGDSSISAAASDDRIVLAPRPCSHRRLFDALTCLTATNSPMSAKRAPRNLGLNEVLAFDATQHLLEAIDSAGESRESVRNRLAQMSVPTVAILDRCHWKFVSRPTAGGPWIDTSE